MVKEEGEKPRGMTVHEALMDRKMQAFFDFLEEKSEDLKDLSFGEKQAEYLRSRGVAEELIENYLKLQERISEAVRKAAQGPVIKIKLPNGTETTFPKELADAIAEARRKDHEVKKDMQGVF